MVTHGVRTMSSAWMFELVLILIFLNKIFIHLFLTLLGLHCCAGFSLVAVSWGYFLALTCGFLHVMASLVAEHRL